MYVFKISVMNIQPARHSSGLLDVFRNAAERFLNRKGAFRQQTAAEKDNGTWYTCKRGDSRHVQYTPIPTKNKGKFNIFVPTQKASEMDEKYIIRRPLFLCYMGVYMEMDIREQRCEPFTAFWQ